MASNKLLDFVEEVVPVQKLTAGVDFEIISYATYDPVEFELISADKYLGIDTLAMLESRSPRSTEALGKMIAKEAARKSGRIPVHVVPTPLPDSPAASFLQAEEQGRYQSGSLPWVRDSKAVES